MHPELGARPQLDPVRIFVVGARAEATLPPDVWNQISYMFPKVPIHVYLIGPEAVILPRNVPSPWNHPMYKERTVSFPFPSRSIAVSENLTLTAIQTTYETVHSFFEPFDPYTDVFFAFAPGFGFPSVIAVEEQARLRAEEREDERRTQAARDTYFARHAPTDEMLESSFRPTEVAKNPAGGDVPSDEPAPAVVAMRPQNAFTSLQAAPVVQAQREWAQSIGQILSTRCPLFVSGFSPADVERDVLAFESVDGVSGEFDWLLTPGENVFASQQWAIGTYARLMQPTLIHALPSKPTGACGPCAANATTFWDPNGSSFVVAESAPAEYADGCVVLYHVRGVCLSDGPGRGASPGPRP